MTRSFAAYTLIATVLCIQPVLLGQVDRQLAKAPREVLKRHEKWKDIVQLSGPPGLRLIKGFHDEALAGEWKGHRSSRLGDQWRVIYRVATDQLTYYVESVTAHDYRRQ